MLWGSRVPEACHPPISELLVDPRRATELSLEQAAACLHQVTALQLVLVGRVAEASAVPAESERLDPPDRMLNAREVADRLGVTVRWLYRHANGLPFTRRLSGRTLRFSAAGVARFLAEKKTLKTRGTYA